MDKCTCASRTLVGSGALAVAIGVGWTLALCVLRIVGEPSPTEAKWVAFNTKSFTLQFTDDTGPAGYMIYMEEAKESANHDCEAALSNLTVTGPDGHELPTDDIFRPIDEYHARWGKRIPCPLGRAAYFGSGVVSYCNGPAECLMLPSNKLVMGVQRLRPLAQVMARAETKGQYTVTSPTNLWASDSDVSYPLVREVVMSLSILLLCAGVGIGLTTVGLGITCIWCAGRCMDKQVPYMALSEAPRGVSVA